MWSNVISLDKGLDREIEFVLNCLRGMRNLSYATEESANRIWIYVASICDAEQIEEEIACIVETVFLTFMKLRYFLNNLQPHALNHSHCALVCSLVHFDRAYEGTIVRRALADTADFNVDGIFNFRLESLKSNWQELVELADRLLSGASVTRDVFDIASFITSTEGAKNRLAVCEDKLINLTKRRTVRILPLFEEKELNLISAIIRERPCEIILDKAILSEAMMDTLRHIAPLTAK